VGFASHDDLDGGYTNLRLLPTLELPGAVGVRVSPLAAGEEHMRIVEELCTAISERWPHCLIQFEDFQTDAAFALLNRLRDRVLCFNDDIQVLSPSPSPPPTSLTKARQLNISTCAASRLKCS
jgi:hypothetical protein